MVRLLKQVPERPPHREQWRLVLLIVPLALVVVLMAQLRDPDTAERINAVFDQVEDHQSIAPRPPGAESPADNVATAPRELSSGLQPERLQQIQDNSYFRNAEQGAWFHFIEVLQRSSAEQLESAHSIEADYTQLVDQPDFYRGKLVTVYGWVRQVTKQTPAANDLGLDTYYRVVVQPTDGVDWPILVYCLTLPVGLSVGDDLMGNMKVTGLFFKNLSYRWQNGLGTAPVILAKSIEYHGAAPGMPGKADIHPPNTTKAWTDGESNGAAASDQTAEASPERGTAFRDILALADWNVERLAEFDDGRPLSDEQRVQSLELLRRLRSFDSASLEDWAHDGLAPYDVLSKPGDYRGQLVRLAGRVTRVTRHVPGAQDAERLEMPEYFECELTPNGEGWTNPMTIFACRVPKAWLRDTALDAPATAVALYLKRLSNGEPPRAIWLAKEVAWHPTTVDEPYVSFGESLLGRLGMDVGLLDGVASHGRLRTADAAARSAYNVQRDAFYQMLEAVGRIDAQDLVRFSQGHLDDLLIVWQRELATTVTESRRNLAREVVERAKAGRYSVAPLFNDPAPQIGRLLVVDGVARRAVRVEVGARPDGGGSSDVARRFGFNHYYEMEVFTDDSKNYPLVFCVRELPAGFPTGGSIHVPVRVAGFFFKDWLYRTRGAGQNEAAGGRAQYAPLLVGRAPRVLVVEQGDGIVHFVLGGLFVAAMAGIWAVAAWYARGDRRFREQTPAAGFSLPAGQSLNELNLSAAEEPMKD